MDRMYREIDRNRRRFLSAAALTLAAAQFGLVRPASAQSKAAGQSASNAGGIDVRQTCHPFPPSISGGSVAMLGPRERGRQSQDDANVKRENSCRHFRQAKGRTFRMHCNIVRMNWS